MRDIAAGITTRVSVNSNGQEGHCNSIICVDGPLGLSLSYDGQVFAFGSWMFDLVAGATNGWPDVFVHDRASGTTTRVSVSSSGAPGDDFSQNPSLSSDGRFVAFDSSSANLVRGDTNGASDVFVHDRWSEVTERVSVDSSGKQTYGGLLPAISRNGRFVAFLSVAKDLVAGDTNDSDDVFLHDRMTYVTSRVSVGLGGQQSRFSFGPYLTVTDAGRVVFATYDPGFALGDNTSTFDVFLHAPSLPTSTISGYCTPKTNSVGCVPRITTTGFPSLTEPAAFFLSTQRVRSQQTGMLIWSTSSLTMPFAGGWRCVGAPIHRTASQTSGGAASPPCSGSYGFHFSPQYLAAQGLAPGATVYAQFYGRDPGFAWPDNAQLTNAVRFVVLP